MKRESVSSKLWEDGGATLNAWLGKSASLQHYAADAISNYLLMGGYLGPGSHSDSTVTFWLSHSLRLSIQRSLTHLYLYISLSIYIYALVCLIGSLLMHDSKYSPVAVNDRSCIRVYAGATIEADGVDIAIRPELLDNLKLNLCCSIQVDRVRCVYPRSSGH